MSRGSLLTVTCALTLGLALAGCGSEADEGPGKPASPSASATADADEVAVIDAYTAFLTEKRAIENSGKVPADAYVATLSQDRIEKERALARGYAESGLVRVGRSEVKDAEVVDLSGDSATLLVCENEDGWGFKPKGKDVQYPKAGWGPRGMKVVREGDRWVVAEAIDQQRLPAKDCTE
ncbi:hypothetical protein GL325_01605 [Aeromicrobium sp. 636]|uniref:Secreted protein/lipoprotein n=1 Tax=Aeromicrobium senzhongii TaxID=2663859 RepID=A0A8I0K1L2_9ACTN|nr:MULTISPECIES: hypothetical protein [Aeromicrobium]MBC9225009.1 hypothetical protein [Aeromicrobium senzhongii]MCQ3997120.1 hypothetical protein [Aeromicrobium sp. 636]MTB87061.1 hypothetical protein [Aeromicrobium senzhongii]QNL93120.1 hypothetical protein H9L21_08160 [Aeromicrobium senzhongii]